MYKIFTILLIGLLFLVSCSSVSNERATATLSKADESVVKEKLENLFDKIGLKATITKEKIENVLNKIESDTTLTKEKLKAFKNKTKDWNHGKKFENKNFRFKKNKKVLLRAWLTWDGYDVSKKFDKKEFNSKLDNYLNSLLESLKENIKEDLHKPKKTWEKYSFHKK